MSISDFFKIGTTAFDIFKKFKERRTEDKFNELYYKLRSLETIEDRAFVFVVGLFRAYEKEFEKIHDYISTKKWTYYSNKRMKYKPLVYKNIKAPAVGDDYRDWELTGTRRIPKFFKKIKKDYRRTVNKFNHYLQEKGFDDSQELISSILDILSNFEADDYIHNLKFVRILHNINSFTIKEIIDDSELYEILTKKSSMHPWNIFRLDDFLIR